MSVHLQCLPGQALGEEARSRWGGALETRIWRCLPAKPHLVITDLKSCSEVAGKVSVECGLCPGRARPGAELDVVNDDKSWQLGPHVELATVPIPFLLQRRRASPRAPCSSAPLTG